MRYRGEAGVAGVVLLIAAAVRLGDAVAAAVSPAAAPDRAAVLSALAVAMTAGVLLAAPAVPALRAAARHAAALLAFFAAAGVVWALAQPFLGAPLYFLLAGPQAAQIWALLLPSLVAVATATFLGILTSIQLPRPYPGADAAAGAVLVWGAATLVVALVAPTWWTDPGDKWLLPLGPDWPAGVAALAAPAAAFVLVDRWSSTPADRATVVSRRQGMGAATAAILLMEASIPVTGLVARSLDGDAWPATRLAHAATTLAVAALVALVAGFPWRSVREAAEPRRG